MSVTDPVVRLSGTNKSHGGGTGTLPRIVPLFAVCEHEECITLSWRNGEKSVTAWCHADPEDCLYHGLSSTEDIEFATVYEAYVWLVKE